MNMKLSDLDELLAVLRKHKVQKYESSAYDPNGCPLRIEFSPLALVEQLPATEPKSDRVVERGPDGLTKEEAEIAYASAG